MEKILGYTKIHTKLHGTVNVRFAKKNMICGAYLVTGYKNGKNLCGLVTKDGKEVIYMRDMKLKELAYNEDETAAYLGFESPKSDIPQYYVVKEDKEKDCRLVTLINNNKNSIPMYFVTIKNTSKLWVLQTDEQCPKYALYDPEKEDVISTSFDYLESVSESLCPEHKLYYSINLASVNYEDGVEEILIHSRLCGFMDEKGNFSSNILDTESGQCYKASFFGPNTLSENFKLLASQLVRKYNQEYQEKEDNINYILANMLNSHNEDPYIESTGSLAKIIKFNNTRGNV